MDIGEVIIGGFRIMRRNPLAVAVWAGVYLLLFLAMMLIMRPAFAAQNAALTGDPQAQLAVFGLMAGRLLLFFLLSIVVYAILFAAPQRAVLQPERQGFFYLRLGMDEVRLLALGLLFVVTFYIATMVLTIVLSLLVGIVTAASQSVGVGAVMAVLEFVVLVGFTAWYFVRFGLAFPLTLMRGKIVIGEAWRISRGRFWPLFGASLVVLLIILVLWFAFLMVTSGAYFGALARSGGNPVAVQQAAQAQMAREFGGLNGASILIWATGSIVGALTVTLWGGAAATAVRQLTFNPKAIAETFA